MCGSQDLEQDLGKLQEDLEKVSKQRGECSKIEIRRGFLLTDSIGDADLTFVCRDPSLICLERGFSHVEELNQTGLLTFINLY